MSKTKISTREAILLKTRELFNSKGAASAGVREIAAAVGIRPGNLTYYFPSKEDLVRAIVREEQDRIDGTLGAVEFTTITAFLAHLEETFLARSAYRGIAVSLPDILLNHPSLRRDVRKLLRKRLKAHQNALADLVRHGQLEGRSSTRIARLAQQIAFMERHWMADAVMINEAAKAERTIPTYVSLIAEILRPHASKSGRKVLKRYAKDVM